VDIDPTKVLSTSWSSGGYLAHYMANRHPERFTCIAPRQSNFSSDVLDEAQVPRYRDTKVGIFYTENDFAICQRESQEGAQWYASRGFDVTFAVFRDLGHARRPSVAADFFARQIDAPAKTPPIELTRMQVTRVPLNGAKNGRKNGEAVYNSNVADALRSADRELAARAPSTTQRGQTSRPQSSLSHETLPQASAGSLAPYAGHLPASADGATPTYDPHAVQSDADALHVRVSSTIGIAPHHVNFTAVAPARLSRGAYFLWSDNGEPIANGVNGQRFLNTPGEHELAVTMTTAEGKQYVARKIVTVLERLRKGNQGR
jgi:pimeloyl-ACP methyl ester carboxylesterase